MQRQTFQIFYNLRDTYNEFKDTYLQYNAGFSNFCELTSKDLSA
jgi:hypothetical protein